MKRLYVNFKVLVVFTILLVLSHSLMAQPRQRRMQQHGETCRYEQIIPGLTDEQKIQMKEIHLATLKEVLPLKDELKVNNARLNLLVKKDNPDMKEIKSLVQANAEMQIKIEILTTESRIKTRSLLTDEQKILLDARLERMQKSLAARGPMYMGGFNEREMMNQQRNRF